LLRRFRNDLYVGDQPIVGSEEQIAGKQLEAAEWTDESKKNRGKTKEGKRRKKKRRKSAQGKSLSKLPAATRLNETVVSQLDINCFANALGKGRIRAPLIEHTSPVKYARSVR